MTASILRRLRLARREPKPKHVEVWGHLVAVNRALTRMTLLAAGISLVAVFGLLWGMTRALSEPLIYYVDSDGRASFGGRRAEATQPKEAEVAYVAKEYLRRTIAFGSLTVERDFAAGFNLMTGALQAQEAERLEDWKRAKGQSFVDYVRAAGIRTSMEVASLDIDSSGGAPFAVRVQGTLHTWPLSGDAQAARHTKAFDSHLVLVATERTETVPNGLLVSHQSIHYRDPQRAADAPPIAGGLEPSESTP